MIKTSSRRRELLTERSLGVSLSECATNLASKYHVSTRTVYRDWHTRNKWLNDVLEIGDPKTFAAQLISSHQEIQRLAFKEYMTLEEGSAKISALNLCRNINKDLEDMVNVPYLIGLLEEVQKS